MQTNYYNRSNNFSAPIRKEPKPYVPTPMHEDIKKEPPKPIQNEPKENGGLLKNMKNDDLLILGIIFLLLSDSNDDLLMIIALGYIFLGGSK